MSINFHKPKKLFNTRLNLDYNKFGEQLSKAQYSLGLLEGSQKKLHNPTLLISPLTVKEATVSSSIEGTQSTVSDVYLYEAGGKPKHIDTPQVVNYRKAMNFAMNGLIKGRSISSHFINTMHGILLKGVRHRGKIGEFRNDKVWIAEREDDPIEEALYVPPQHYLVPEYMEDLIKYISQGKENALIKAGLSHYQFEAIHPFNDGNGRIGRLLIPLILCYKNRLTHPILYISGYLEKNRDDYIESLHRVDVTGNYEDWLNFYFNSVSNQLEETQKLIDSIYNLYEYTKEKIRLSKSPYFIPFLDFVFKSPIFTIQMAKNNTGVSTRTTILNLIKTFEAKGFIIGLDVRKERAKLYIFDPLIKLLQA